MSEVSSRSGASTPRGFDPRPASAIPPARGLSRTIWFGCAVVALLVVGLGLWAALSPITGAVTASGVVKVENNRQTLRRLEAGTVRRILVHEGDHVQEGQLLLVFNDAERQAQSDVLQSSYDSLIGEEARYEAELAHASSVQFPQALSSRRADPSVAAVIQTEERLFRARQALLQSQMAIGGRRVQQLNRQIDGSRAQVSASDRQLALNADELKGVQTLYDSGYAPKTRLLTLERNEASLSGSRGEQMSEIARAEQAIGEARVQTLSALQTRIGEAAQGLQQTRDKIADVLPRLAAAREALTRTEMRAPKAGVVLNLTQNTVGGAVNAGEPLMDIVPSDTPLVLEVMVRPQDVHAVHPGQDAQITLTGFSSRNAPQMKGVVTRVSADQTVEQRTGRPFFTAQLKSPPSELARLPPGIKLSPGLPVTVNFVTGRRSVLDYLLAPLTALLGRSMHEA